MLNPRTVKEALDIVYTQLNNFEYILLQGDGQFGYDPKILSIALGYWNNRIVIHLLDEDLVKLCSCSIDNSSLIQNKLTRFIKGYRLEIQNIAFIYSSETKEISEFAYINKRQIFKICSTKIKEQTVSVSYDVVGRASNYILFQLTKSFENFIRTIHENSDIQVVMLNPHPITLIRSKKIKELEIDLHI